MRRLVLVASLAFAWLAAPQSAGAADKKSASTNDAQADALLASGNAHFKAQRYPEARDAFKQSYDLAPRAGTLMNLALAELQTNDPLAALRHLREYLRASDATPDRITYVEEKLVPRALALVGQLTIEAPADWHVHVDDAEAGVAPLKEPIAVLPGSHDVLAYSGGTTTRAAHITVGSGQTLSLKLEMPAPAPVTPIVTAAPKEQPRETGHPFFTWKTATVLTLAVGAVGTAIGGIYFAVDIDQQNSRADTNRALVGPGRSACYQVTSAPCSELSDAVHARANDLNMRDTLFVVSGGLAVGAVAALIFWPSPSSPSSSSSRGAWIAPSASPGVAGVDVGGRF